MEQRTSRITCTLFFGAAALSAVACGGDDQGLGEQHPALVPACAEADTIDELPAGAWMCPDARTIECASAAGGDAETLYVRDREDASCAETELTLSDDGPFAVGEHAVTVRDGEGDELCSAELTVVDTNAPELEAHTIQLWPPNHKLHSIAVSDCVSFVDACEGELVGEFIWATSDEPVDDKGDGHHAPDIQLDDCGNVSVRSERAGPKNGRVYKLGVRVIDAVGNASEGECSVIVDHDQRGVAGADNGEAYRITFDGARGGPACDGIIEHPVVDEGGDGDGDGDGDGEEPGDGDGDGVGVLQVL